jgi:hypothetical protein
VKLISGQNVITHSTALTVEMSKLLEDIGRPCYLIEKPLSYSLAVEPDKSST